MLGDMLKVSKHPLSVWLIVSILIEGHLVHQSHTQSVVAKKYGIIFFGESKNPNVTDRDKECLEAINCI